jgi:hypothetical protein
MQYTYHSEGPGKGGTWSKDVPVDTHEHSSLGPGTWSPNPEEPKKSAAELPAFGYYDVDGKIYHWDEFTKKSAYGTVTTTTKVMKLSTVQKWDYKTSAYVTKGKWTWHGSAYLAKKLLTGLTPMSLDAVKAKGKECTFCIRCGRLLTDPFSVANGIGPVCITYWS